MKEVDGDERRLERDWLDAAVRRFPLVVRAARQHLFQMHVSLNVVRATPVVERIKEFEGIDLFDPVPRIQAPPIGRNSRCLATRA